MGFPLQWTLQWPEQSDSQEHKWQMHPASPYLEPEITVSQLIN